MLPEVPVDLIREALDRGRSVRVRARGISMQPLIPDGSTVELVPLSRQVAVGDVVAVDASGELLIHRVHQTGAEIELRGDRNLRPDAPVADADVLGLARRVITPSGLEMRLDTAAARLLSRTLMVPMTRLGSLIKKRVF